MEEIVEILRDTFDNWNKDHAPRLGAALAYYTVFSIGPLLIIAIAIASLVFGQQAAQGQLIGQFRSLLGDQGASFLQIAIENAYRPGTGVLASLIGIVTLLLGALGLFGQLQDALNTIWQVTPKPGRSIMRMLRNRALSFSMVLVIGFLFLVSLAISAGLAALVRYFGNMLPISANMLQGANFFGSLVVVTILFALIFKYLPDAVVRWRDLWTGAILTSLLFTIGMFLLDLYIRNGAFGSTYGAAGSILIVLVWIYYSAQILFFGAEFTKTCAIRYGNGIVPTPNAERVKETLVPSRVAAGRGS